MLVVDDDPLVLENTVAMLDDMGHAVIEARSGHDALAHVSNLDTSMDLVVADQMMPGMTGLELIAQTRQIRPDVVAILASGFADIPTGAAPDLPRLPKPFDQNALARAIAAAMRRGKATDGGPADVNA